MQSPSQTTQLLQGWNKECDFECVECQKTSFHGNREHSEEHKGEVIAKYIAKCIGL